MALRTSPLPLLLAVSAITFAASPAWPAGEAKMYAITDWSLGNYGAPGACAAGNRPDWDDMADGWYDAVDDYGFFFKDGRLVNGNFTRSILCDPDTGLSGCDDGDRLDDADAAIVALHGSDVGKHWRGALRFDGSPNFSDCGIDAPEGGGGEMFLGDADLEFLHLSSCHSMDDDNLSETWRMFQDPVDSPKNGHRLHMATGFHGLMWIGSGRSDDYANFAFGGQFLMAYSWLDSLYDWDVNGDGYEQCPVAYAIGANESDCVNRLTTEGYGHIINPDPKISYTCALWYEGCDPKGDGPFSLD